jgi:hypothetical protein
MNILKAIPPGIIWLYAIVYVCLLPLYQHQINPDAVSYIACAEAYASGNLQVAVNGYWSPLLCWMLVPFIKTGIEPLLAIKIINLVCSVPALFLLLNIANRFVDDLVYRVVLLIAACMHLLVFSLTASTPDVLSWCAMTWVLYLSLLLLEKPGILNAIWLGIAGAASYFSKYYQFYVFLLVLVLLAIYLVITHHRKQLRYVLISSAIFLCAAGVWIILLHDRYGVFTITTASAFNTALAGEPGFNYPFLNGQSLSYLDYSFYTYTSWEDPSLYRLSGWSPLVPASSLLPYLIHTIRWNMHVLRLYFGAEMLLIAAAAVMLIVSRKPFRSPLIFMMLIVCFYPSGYMLTLAENRYMLFPVITGLMIFFAVTDTTWSATRKNITAACFVLILCRITAPIIYERPSANMAKQDLTLPVISGKRVICSPASWPNALYACYFSKGKLYDSFPPDTLSASFIASHPEHDYYLCKQDEVPVFLKNNTTIHAGSFVLIALR